MKLNKNSQYALLFVMYLTRAGTATVQNVADELRLSYYMLEQVARDLRIAGIVRSIRGPGGGFQLIGEPTGLQVLKAMGIDIGLVETDMIKFNAGPTIEEQSFLSLVSGMSNAVRQALSTPLRNVVIDTTLFQVKALADTASDLTSLAS